MMNSMIPPARAEPGKADPERAEHRLAEEGEVDQDAPGDGGRSHRHLAPVTRVAATGERGEDRRAARRVDDYEQGDEGRGEQLDHSDA
jgi:hypothetical protein